MKKNSLSLRLWSLSAVLILVILVVAIVNHKKAQQLMSNLENVSKTQLPAVHSMTLVDMMHDGLRAVVMSSYFGAMEKDAEVLNANKAEVLEFSNNIKKYMGEIAALDVDPETKKLIADSKGDLNLYSDLSQEMVSLAIQGKMDDFRKRIPDFMNSFELLEKRLGSLGDRIEADASKVRDEGKDVLMVSSSIAFIGIFLAIAMTIVLVRSLVREVSEVAGSISKTSEMVETIAGQISNASQSLSASTTEQAAALQQTASAINETSAMVGKNADNAEQSSRISRKSVDSFNGGKQVVDEMIVSIEEIADSNAQILQQIEESNREISGVIDVIREIGNKTKVINEIVFQTKLLSFNASVEAARAGESGKGFAVVAEEVGNLAQMSGNSAKEITDLLEGSIQKVEEIVTNTNDRVQALIQNGKSKIENGTRLGKLCADVFDRVTADVSQVGTVLSEITFASQEQAKGIKEINKAIGEIDNVAQQNNLASQKVAGSAEDLDLQVGRLRELISRLDSIVNGKTS